MATTCPHCAALNADGTSFCVSCGKAVPSMGRTTPRVLSGQDLATSSAGQSVQLDDLTRQIRPAVKTLFWVGLLHALIGAGIAVVGLVDKGAHSATALIVGTIVGVIGAGFLAMSHWARKSPLPATITGLTVYATLVALDIIATTTSGNTVQLGAGLWIRVAIIAILARAVSAAVKHRALSRQMAESSGTSMPGRMAA